MCPAVPEFTLSGLVDLQIVGMRDLRDWRKHGRKRKRETRYRSIGE